MPKRLEIVIISTCTNQKKGQVAEEFHLGKWAGLFYRDAARKWVDALETASHPTVPASELYLGSHWNESLACLSAARKLGFFPSLRVLSAGYGFIGAEEPLLPYAASFAAGGDSIQNLNWPDDPSPKQKARMWWEMIHRYRNREGLTSLTEQVSRTTPLLMVMSREYYAAVETEIIDLISAGLNVLIVSAGLFQNLSSVSPVVRPHVLPFSDSFKQVDDYLNKTNVSLNARLAHWLIQNHGDTLHEGISKVGPTLTALAESLPAMERREVNPMTDEEVLAFIEKHYEGRGDSATKLLNKLRHEAQLSCEQKRFGALFKTFTSSLQRDLFDHE